MPALSTTEEAGARDAQTRPTTPPHQVPLETPGAGPSRLATPDPELDTAFERELALDPGDEEQDRENCRYTSNRCILTQ